MLALALTLAPLLQVTDLGEWEAPFNHVVPPAWERNQPLWDGEPFSPYGDPLQRHRFMAGHIALIGRGRHRGKLLVFNWMRKDYTHGVQHWALVDLSTSPPTFENFSLPMPDGVTELFCAGHAWTQAGDLLIAGGARYPGGILSAHSLCYRFDPEAPTGNAMWVREPDLDTARWYPTVTPMGDAPSGVDQVLVSGGLKDPLDAVANRSYESFWLGAGPGLGQFEANPVLGRAIFRGPPVRCTANLGIYPRDVLLSTGAKFSAGMASLGYRLEHTPGGVPRWEVQPSGDSRMRWYGSAFLMPDIASEGGLYRDTVVRLGGALVDWDVAACVAERFWVPLSGVELCRAAAPAGDPQWSWNPGPSMARARNHPSTTLLPDGTVLVTGGRTDTGNQFRTQSPVLEAEVFHETPLAWRTLAPASVRRGYHSATVLLPDGRVLVGGGEQRELDYEIFRPPYLTDGSVRPVVLGAPGTLSASYGSTHWLGYGALPAGVKVERVVALRTMAATHHSDTNQRYVELEVLANGSEPGAAGRVQFRLPTNSNVAPRGDYMLFLVTTPQRAASRGTPSDAVWLTIE